MWWLLLLILIFAPVLGFILWDIIWSAWNRSKADFWFGVFALVLALVCVAAAVSMIYLVYPH
jgi:hypothetical protein